jgi:hypothetical protein
MRVLEETVAEDKDPSFVTTLSRGKAARRLLRMPHDEALSVIATAPADDMAEVLKVMLEVDTVRATTLLSGIHDRKAQDLIELIKDVSRQAARLDNGGFQHYASNDDLKLLDGRRGVRAICGWTWVPHVTGRAIDLPICPRCQAIYDSLPES